MSVDENPVDDLLDKKRSMIAAELDGIRNAITRADTKAGTLLGWLGTALSIMVAFLAVGSDRLGGMQAVAVFVGLLGVALLAVCVVMLVTVIRPDLREDVPEGEAVDGWIRLSKAKDPGEILDILAEEARSDSTDDGLRLARRLLGLSRLAARKHRRTRVATFILTAAVILFVISAIASVGGLVGVA